MARIWPIYEGAKPSRGEPWADLPLAEAISVFELRRDDFISDLQAIPRFGNEDRDLWFLGYKHIVVEIGRAEGRREKWKPGFYHSRVKPEDGFERLLKHSLVAELGAENVIRVKLEPTTDSRSENALRVTVVIAPDATEKLAQGATLSALVRLQERLSEMQDERTPIIEYSTEAELAQDGGP